MSKTIIWSVVVFYLVSGIRGVPECGGKTCTTPEVLYTKNCVCLPRYVLAGCEKTDYEGCDKVIKAGFCNTISYILACTHGCGWCDKDFVNPPEDKPMLFFPPERSVEELFAVDCGTPPSLKDGNYIADGTTFTYLARYACDTYFDMTGQNVIKCLGNGTWSDLTAVCSISGFIVSTQFMDLSVLSKTGDIRASMKLTKMVNLFYCSKSRRVFFELRPVVSYALNLTDPKNVPGTDTGSFPTTIMMTGSSKRKELYFIASSTATIIRIKYDGSDFSTLADSAHASGASYFTVDDEAGVLYFTRWKTKQILAVTLDGEPKYSVFLETNETPGFMDFDAENRIMYWCTMNVYASNMQTNTTEFVLAAPLCGGVKRHKEHLYVLSFANGIIKKNLVTKTTTVIAKHVTAGMKRFAIIE